MVRAYNVVTVSGNTMTVFTVVSEWLDAVVLLVYVWIQVVISVVFGPPKPCKAQFGHVAVIGAGVTGISTASQLISHGFEVTIFEAHDQIGGIWSCVNSTSGLQINSILYRFHPKVIWNSWYPHRDQVLKNVHNIWTSYNLESRTRFNTRVTRIDRHASSEYNERDGGHSRWVINGNQSEVYDGIVATVGTCGEPKMISLPGMDDFRGEIVHSSKLDDVNLKGKRVVIIGGGASGVEALERAVDEQAASTTIIARSDKWFIPRNLLVDTLLSMQPFGRETRLSRIPEFLLARFHYRDLCEKMLPTQGFYTGTPVVNQMSLQYIREGKADYQRGDIIGLDKDGVNWNARRRGQRKGSEGTHEHMEADVIILAAGFQRPKLDFLPVDLFPAGYVRNGANRTPPDMYLQVFPVTDWSVLCTNATFDDAVGTVGHVHIGIFARILATVRCHANSSSWSPSPVRIHLACGCGWIQFALSRSLRRVDSLNSSLTWNCACGLLVSLFSAVASRCVFADSTLCSSCSALVISTKCLKPPSSVLSLAVENPLHFSYVYRWVYIPSLGTLGT